MSIYAFWAIMIGFSLFAIFAFYRAFKERSHHSSNDRSDPVDGTFSRIPRRDDSNQSHIEFVIDIDGFVCKRKY